MKEKILIILFQGITWLWLQLMQRVKVTRQTTPFMSIVSLLLSLLRCTNFLHLFRTVPPLSPPLIPTFSDIEMTESPEGWVAGAYVNWFVDISDIETDVQELQYSSDMITWNTLAAITLSNSTGNISSYRIPSSNTLYSTYYVNLPAGSYSILVFFLLLFLCLLLTHIHRRDILLPCHSTQWGWSRKHQCHWQMDCYCTPCLVRRDQFHHSSAWR